MPKTFWITSGAKTALMAERNQLGPNVVSRSHPKGVFTMLTPFNQVGNVT